MQDFVCEHFVTETSLSLILLLILLESSQHVQAFRPGLKGTRQSGMAT